MNLVQKQQTVASLKEAMNAAKGVIFVDYTGLTVEDANKFRRTLQKVDIKYQVVKNTIANIAMADMPFAELGKTLKGTPTGIIFGSEDAVATAKATYAFMKECKSLKVKAGILEGEAIDAKAVQELSKMKSKEEMQAEVVSLALSPGRTIAGQLKFSSGRIVGAIEALAKKLDA